MHNYEFSFWKKKAVFEQHRRINMHLEREKPYHFFSANHQKVNTRIYLWAQRAISVNGIVWNRKISVECWHILWIDLIFLKIVHYFFFTQTENKNLYWIWADWIDVKSVGKNKASVLKNQEYWHKFKETWSNEGRYFK